VLPPLNFSTTAVEFLNCIYSHVLLKKSKPLPSRVEVFNGPVIPCGQSVAPAKQ